MKWPTMALKMKCAQKWKIKEFNAASLKRIKIKSREKKKENPGEFDVEKFRRDVTERIGQEEGKESADILYNRGRSREQRGKRPT